MKEWWWDCSVDNLSVPYSNCTMFELFKMSKRIDFVEFLRMSKLLTNGMVKVFIII